MVPRSQTNSTSLTGWTVGGGLEWKLAQNWFVRGEYRYSDYGHWQTSFFANQAGAGNPLGVDFNSANIHVTTSVATVGLAYKFNWASPVVAKN